METQIIKESPILVSGPLVRAILSGEKTQTRRLLRVQPEVPLLWYPTPHSKRSLAYDGEAHFRRGVMADFSPWKVGDRLWVRESWMPGYDHQSVDQGDDKSICEVIYRGPGDANVSEFRPAPDDVAEEWVRNYSEDGDDDPRWRPSIHMPRWASRISLEVTEVRVQRIQDISEEDARAEGLPSGWYDGKDLFSVAPSSAGGSQWHLSARMRFEFLWKETHGRESWGANPWVWAVSFRCVL